MNNKVAIIIVNYNGLSDTLECIESVNNSTISVDIIVVDNASCGDEIKKIGEKHKNVKIIASSKNLGFAGGNNIAIVYALLNNYEYIVLLNNDTIIDSHMVELLVGNTDKNHVAVPVMRYYYDKEMIWYGGGKVNKITGNVTHYLKNKKVKNIAPMECTFASGCCISIHRSIFEKIGLLDDRYFMYCEDTDFCIRLGINKINIRLIPDAILWHKVSKSTGGETSALSTYFLTRNRILCIKKYSNYFYKTALIYTVATRYIRMLQFKMKNKKEWKAFRKAMNDARKGVIGNPESYI